MSSEQVSTILLEILHGCNLRCNYCYIGTEKNHVHPYVPPLEQTLEIINLIHHQEINEVILLGGEPTLHPHFVEICHEIAALGFASRGLVTNGTNLSEQILETLATDKFWIDVSIRASDFKAFDTITGVRGSFDKLTECLRLLKKYEFPVALEYDCTAKSYDKLYSSIKYVHELGTNIKQIQLHRLIPSGDARANWESLQPSLAQYRIALEQLKQLQVELKVGAIVEDTLPFCLVDQDFWDLIGTCACGYSMLTADPHGNIRHCACSDYHLGNIFEDTISNLVTDLQVNYQDPANFCSECLACDLLCVCRGGCRSTGSTSTLNGFDIFLEQFSSIQLDNLTTIKQRAVFGQDILDNES